MHHHHHMCDGVNVQSVYIILCGVIDTVVVPLCVVQFFFFHGWFFLSWMQDYKI